MPPVKKSAVQNQNADLELPVILPKPITTRYGVEDTLACRDVLSDLDKFTETLQRTSNDGNMNPAWIGTIMVAQQIDNRVGQFEKACKIPFINLLKRLDERLDDQLRACTNEPTALGIHSCVQKVKDDTRIMQIPALYIINEAMSAQAGKKNILQLRHAQLVLEKADLDEMEKSNAPAHVTGEREMNMFT